MKIGMEIKGHYRFLVFWYMVVLFICFVGAYFLAGPWSLIQFCGDGIHFFQVDICSPAFNPLIVQMNAETIIPEVKPLLTPLSYTEHVGWHLFGTDALGRDVFAGILYGGQRSLVIAIAAGGLAMVLGWFIGLWSVYVQWAGRFALFWWIFIFVFIAMGWMLQLHYFWYIGAGLLVFRLWTRKKISRLQHKNRRWWWSRWIEWYQALPDLLLILVLSAAIGVLNTGGLILIIIVVVWPSLALVARRVGTEVSQQPYFLQALRNRVPGRYLFLNYLWGNTKAVFWAFFPLVAGRVILLESTISFLGLGLPPDQVTLGSMISSARYHMEAWWLIVFPGLFIFLLVYPLLLWRVKAER